MRGRKTYGNPRDRHGSATATDGPSVLRRFLALTAMLDAMLTLDAADPWPGLESGLRETDIWSGCWRSTGAGSPLDGSTLAIFIGRADRPGENGGDVVCRPADVRIPLGARGASIAGDAATQQQQEMQATPHLQRLRPG